MKLTAQQLRRAVREALEADRDMPVGLNRVVDDAELVFAAATRLVRAAQNGDVDTVLKAAQQVGFYAGAVKRDVENVGV